MVEIRARSDLKAFSGARVFHQTSSRCATMEACTISETYASLRSPKEEGWSVFMALAFVCRRRHSRLNKLPAYSCQFASAFQSNCWGPGLQIAVDDIPLRIIHNSYFASCLLCCESWILLAGFGSLSIYCFCDALLAGTIFLF